MLPTDVASQPFSAKQSSAAALSAFRARRFFPLGAEALAEAGITHAAAQLRVSEYVK